MNIGIIGAGISGISAAYNLQKRHNITLIESKAKLGGHSNTINVMDDNSKELNIDTGFIVMNPKNYPNFYRFLKELNIQLIESEMSFSYYNNVNKIQYAGTLKGLIPNLRKLVSFKHYKLLYSIVKYSKIMYSDYKSDKLENKDTTISEYLTSIKCPKYTIQNYFYPIAASIWSSPQYQIENYPAKSYIEFFNNHGLLKIFNRKKWFTIKGGSEEYIRRFEHQFNGTIIKNTTITNIIKEKDEIIVNGQNNYLNKFDIIILSCHANEALNLINSPSKYEYNTLSAFKYTKNNIILHTDTSIMPKNKKIWASWNFISLKDESNNINESLHYYMNRLQKLDSKKNYIVSVNPSIKPSKKSIIYNTEYTHPILGKDAINMQKELNNLNKQSRILFSGAYFGFGFHEDGYLSGLNVSKEILKRF
ncbi:MAG: NAD(P)/FAD-dependent oxidoreductase [Dehalococcoidia bacterium]